MENQMIITIGRTFGSKGREIGEKLASELGISFYDKNLITIAAEKSGLTVELLDSADEKILNRFLDPFAVSATIQGSTNDRLFRAESEIIREIAERESCVLVGRLADQLLKDNPNCLKIFIYAPIEQRVKTIMERHGLDGVESRRLVKQMDKIRGNYYSYFSDGKWEQKEGKDILVNSAMLGVDGTVELLKHVVKLRFL